MYILDEAASNIDVESEDQIMEVVRELAKTKTGPLYLPSSRQRYSLRLYLYDGKWNDLRERNARGADASKWKLRRHVPAATGFMQDQGCSE